MKLIKKPNVYRLSCSCCGAVFETKNKDWKNISHDESFVRLTTPCEKSLSGYKIEYIKYKNTIINCPICGNRVAIYKERVE